MYKSFNTCPDELSEFLLSIFFFKRHSPKKPINHPPASGHINPNASTVSLKLLLGTESELVWIMVNFIYTEGKIYTENNICHYLNNIDNHQP